MSGLFAQFQAFVLTMILGILTGVIFQYYQLTIRRARVGRYLLYILDFTLWVMLIFIVFVGMLLINQGEMRVYVLLALLAGVVIYYRALSQRLDKPISIVANLTVSLIGNTIGIMVKGLRYCRNFVKESLKKDKGPPPDEHQD